ncbi:MAG: A/G-specific adenine glycosylase [Urechidicola sp.]|nr:A/G-specific adenine glycosylase [Urechidicola sp.]
MKFSKSLIYWYLREKRDLPWRNTDNPYFIWLSEIILQQTRVDQGMSYYLKFIDQFPTVLDLANAKEYDILKLWQGLGYYSRARNLHFSANYIVDELDGIFPNTFSEILKLKGVGDYTASAIASICFNEPRAVVDGNVYRVLSRYFRIETPINSSRGIKEFKNLAQELLDENNPATHNQAIMEFGARMCKPQNPDCTICPLNDSCIALQQNKIKSLPVKDKKVKIRKRYFNYLVMISDNGKTKLNMREGKGIWQNLYEFPLIESENEIEVKELINQDNFKKLVANNKVSIQLYNKDVIIHKLSHQHIFTKFYIVKNCADIDAEISWKKIDDFPVPKLIHNFIEELKSTDIFSIFE